MAGKFGVLALQGGFAAHVATLGRLGVHAVEVRRPSALAGLGALVLPGGESTTMLHLMAGEPWAESLRALHARGGALLGTCAGAILLARLVVPDQFSLGLVDVDVERNAFGRQVESFEADVETTGVLGPGPLRGVFIRAPRLVRIGPAVEVLARLAGEPVLVRQGRVLAGTFHPELTGSLEVHRLLCELSSPAVPKAS